MAENLHDTPATYEQNLAYLKNPESPESKKYSSKQAEANIAHKTKVMLYHADHDGGVGGRVFDREDAEDAAAAGWVDTPFKHPNNPDHQPVPEPVASPERDMLIDEAEKLGITIDKRWGLERLRKAIVKAQPEIDG